MESKCGCLVHLFFEECCFVMNIQKSVAAYKYYFYFFFAHLSRRLIGELIV